MGRPKQVCSVDQCDRAVRTRGWCDMHYKRWWKHGDPLHQPFNPTICQMDDCHKPTGIAAASGGLCRMHYKRYLAWGDPFFAGFSRRNQCSIEDCDAPAYSQTWCSTHYHRWRRLGSPTARLKGEVVDGKRICASCDRDLPLTDFGNSYCRECTNAKASQRRAANPTWLEKTERWPAECDFCSQAFMANKRRSRYCSRECSAADKHRANWKHLNARKARLREAYVESFDRREIFERDGWICGLCTRAIDPVLAWPDPWSASLDHVVPIARGGQHSRANAQASHLHCNVVKSDRLEEVAV